MFFFFAFFSLSLLHGRFDVRVCACVGVGVCEGVCVYVCEGGWRGVGEREREVKYFLLGPRK